MDDTLGAILIFESEWIMWTWITSVTLSASVLTLVIALYLLWCWWEVGR